MLGYVIGAVFRSGDSLPQAEEMGVMKTNVLRSYISKQGRKLACAHSRKSWTIIARMSIKQEPVSSYSVPESLPGGDRATNSGNRLGVLSGHA